MNGMEVTNGEFRRYFSQWRESQKTLVLNLRRNHVAGKVTNIATKQGYRQEIEETYIQLVVC
jgi:hypothetical protein